MPDDHVHVSVLLEVIMPIMGKPLVTSPLHEWITPILLTWQTDPEPEFALDQWSQNLHNIIIYAWSLSSYMYMRTFPD